MYLSDASGNRTPPRDVDCFLQLKLLADRFGAEKVYSDYVKVYAVTGKEVNREDLRGIGLLAESYGTYALQMDKVLSGLYMAMIAEEKKAGTHLGKRIKRLGIHKLLVENNSVRDSASFMKGMDWRDIDRLCEERGF